jgi:dTDP-4-dehydrorhamnose reductase
MTVTVNTGDEFWHIMDHLLFSIQKPTKYQRDDVKDACKEYENKKKELESLVEALREIIAVGSWKYTGDKEWAAPICDIAREALAKVGR